MKSASGSAAFRFRMSDVLGSEAVRKAICALASKGIESDAAFDQVAPALLQFGEEDLAERVMGAAGDAPWEGIAAFLNIASWDVSPTAETRIFRTIERWLLEGEDLRRVQVALHIEVIPFSKKGADAGLLKQVLDTVSAKFPETEPRCRHMLEQAAILRFRREKDDRAAH